MRFIAYQVKFLLYGREIVSVVIEFRAAIENMKFDTK